MLDGFAARRIRVADDVALQCRIGGSGPPVLLLHGYPQTHMCWHRIAPALARSRTVILPDLRGCGRSDAPPSTADHAPYAFRSMAADMSALLDALGIARADVVGHDRGARVAHRLCLDAPHRVARAAVLDIAPTLDVYERTDMAFATAYWHWFWLLRPAPGPEREIARAPDEWVTGRLADWSRLDGPFDAAFHAEAVADYVAAFGRPEVVHATCEDYRAAATIDLENDRADRDRRLDMPFLAMWGTRGFVGRTYDVLGLWRRQFPNALGAEVDCGHFLPEEAPEATLSALTDFLDGPGAPRAAAVVPREGETA